MKRLHILITALVALSVVLLGAGAVLAGDPGVTDNEIVIGTSAGLTGPIAMWGNRMARIGPQAYFNYINEQGGVHGRKIKHVILDDGYQPPRSVANHKRLIQRDKVFALLASMGTPTVTASIQTILSNKVPLIAPATGAHKWGYDEAYRPWVFQVGADYWHMAAVAVDYVIEHKGVEISFVDLQGLLKGLSPRKMQAVELNVIHDMKQREVAEIMGIRTVTVGQYVDAAIQQLVDQYFAEEQS